MWFLPSVYLFRQSIELLIKAGLAKIIKFKPDLQKAFEKGKHNLVNLFQIYKEKADYLCYLTYDEQYWLENYLISIEEIDANSDLFRYPFKDDFLSKYQNEFLDIVDMGNSLIVCYSILNKCIFGCQYKDNEININEKNEFITLASDGINNCYLWESQWGDGFHKQVTGYSECAEYLFEIFSKNKSKDFIYPTIFLLRNAIELALKRLLNIQTRFRIPENKIRKIINTHLLYKVLWKNIKPVILHYANNSGEDLEQIDIAENYIKEIERIDKNGDMFRYPCSYSLEYRFNNKVIDFQNIYIFLQSIFNFLDGCDGMLDNIMDYENEIDSYYEY